MSCPFAALAIGATQESVNGQIVAGAVTVLYGSSARLTATGSQLWHRDSPGVMGPAQAGAKFGAALAWGDFDGDGCPDLAIGVPGSLVQSSGNEGTGAVTVLYGASQGLSAAGDQIWSQDTPGILGEPDVDEDLGHALAAADFDGDGFDDLAIGVPYDGVAEASAGAVNVLYGSGAGLSAAGDQLWHQGSPGVLGVPEAFKHLGFSLAAGDFDGDGYADLAAGVPHESVGADDAAGAVNVLFGSVNGLSSAGDQLWHQDSPGVLGVAEPGDRLGWRLAAGDFDGDGRDDLAVSALLEDVNDASGAGSVNVLYGCAAGLCSTGNEIWHQDTPHVMGVAEDGDHFGSALASGDFDGDGFDDLAIGVDEQTVAGVENAGAVAVLYGTPAGLTPEGDEIWTAAGLGIPAGGGAFFGNALAAEDFDGDGRGDLAIGAPSYDVNGVGNAGAVSVLYGCAGGLCAGGSQLWTQDSPGVAGAAEEADFFGAGLGSTPGS